MIGTISFLLALAAPLQAEECPQSNVVHYSTPSKVQLAERVIFKDGHHLLPPGLEGIASPQRTSFLYFLENPDFTKKGPWNVRISISGNEAHPVHLGIEFLDVGNGGVQAKWLNENLLFAQVWWGRLVSTDLIIDVEKKRFLYAEEADYMMASVPCSERRGIQRQ